MKKPFINEDAIVLTSGGQDSTTSLFWARENFKTIYALSFHYGQSHDIEVATAQKICSQLNIRFQSVDISFLKNLVVSSLTGNDISMNAPHPLNENVPSTFVPYRNMIFLTLAAARASSLQIRHLVTGVCQTDYSGYADCRDLFIKSCETTLNLAVDFKEQGIMIHTPLMWLTKADEFRMAREGGYLDFIINETVTCYRGVIKKNEWGKGCGECPACLLRKKGYEEFILQTS